MFDPVATAPGSVTAAVRFTDGVTPFGDEDNESVFPPVKLLAIFGRPLRGLVTVTT